MLNDPNGLAYFRGQVYVFFQWNRFEKNHSHKEWGYFTTSDYLTWKFLGSAIIPDQAYDIDGIYSGSGLPIENELYLFYTGNNKQKGIRKSAQCLVTTKDGKTFQKQGILLSTPNTYTQHFRDPKVVKIDATYWMVIGAQTKEGKGAIALCESSDGRTWTYRHALLHCDEHEMIECPDMFSLAQQDVVLYCPQKRDNEKDCCLSSFAGYQLGIFDQKLGTFTCSHEIKKLDEGFDFYAPQTFLDKKRRRILLAWMSNMDEEEEQAFAKISSSLHCLTMPRELYIKDNQLYQKPIEEMYQLRGDALSSYEDGDTITIPYETAAYIHIEHITDTLYLSCFQGNYQLHYDDETQEVVIQRKHCVHGYIQEKRMGIQVHSIEAWVDTSSIEIFLNEGMMSITSRVFPTDDNNIIIKKQNTIKMQANCLRGYHIK